MTDFQKLVNDIRDKADIVKIIGEHVRLEKQGAGFVGLCPFHDDKNPSLSVSPSKKIYKCFSCNASGNAITFIEKYKKIPFMDALREVGSTVGIAVNETKTERLLQQNQKYYNIMNDATQFFRFYLKNTIEGQDALRYLNSRRLTTDIINEFKIGLSSSDMDLLYSALVEKKHLPVDILEVGLIKSGKDNYYDTFRKRIIFPITDLDGNVVGFSGRKYISSSDEPKYVNSNENVIFKKGQILYHYYEAFNEIKRLDRVFLFEGFMDVIAAYRADVFNTVASMGTSLTFDQIKAIKRLTNNVTICYDGDKPGIEATKRAIKMLVNQQVATMVVSMPDGLDPDEYIAQYGSSKLNDFLHHQAISAIEFLYNQAKQMLVLEDISSAEQFKHEMFQSLHWFNSSIVTETFLKKMAQDLNVSVTGLSNDFNATQHMEPSVPVAHQETSVATYQLKKERKIQRDKKVLQAIECQLIQIALKLPEHFKEIECKLSEYKYFYDEYGDIMIKLRNFYSTQTEIEFNENQIKNELVSKCQNDHDNILQIFDQIMEFKIELDESKSKYPIEQTIKDLLDKRINIHLNLYNDQRKDPNQLEKNENDLRNIQDIQRKKVKIKYSKD